MFAPQSPHFRLNLTMEQKFPPYGPCWSSTMFIKKHMWIHHKTVILSMCIMRLNTSSSCLHGAHIYPSSCARSPPEIYGNDLPMRYECRLPAWLFKELFYVRNVDFMGINTDVSVWLSHPTYPLIMQYVSTITPGKAPSNGMSP